MYKIWFPYLLFDRSSESRMPVDVDGWSLDESNTSIGRKEWPRISTSESSLEELSTIISCVNLLLLVATSSSSSSESNIIVSLWLNVTGIGIAVGISPFTSKS